MRILTAAWLLLLATQVRGQTLLRGGPVASTLSDIPVPSMAPSPSSSASEWVPGPAPSAVDLTAQSHRRLPRNERINCRGKDKNTPKCENRNNSNKQSRSEDTFDPDKLMDEIDKSMGLSRSNSQDSFDADALMDEIDQSMDSDRRRSDSMDANSGDTDRGQRPRNYDIDELAKEEAALMDKEYEAIARRKKQKADAMADMLRKEEVSAFQKQERRRDHGGHQRFDRAKRLHGRLNSRQRDQIVREKAEEMSTPAKVKALTRAKKQEVDRLEKHKDTSVENKAQYVRARKELVTIASKELKRKMKIIKEDLLPVLNTKKRQNDRRRLKAKLQKYKQKILDEEAAIALLEQDFRTFKAMNSGSNNNDQASVPPPNPYQQGTAGTGDRARVPPPNPYEQGKVETPYDKYFG